MGAGGRPAGDDQIKRFQNPEMRARIAKEIEDALDARFGGAKGVYLPQTGQQLVSRCTGNVDFGIVRRFTALES